MSDVTRPVSRRTFLRQSAAVGAAGMAAPYFVPASALASPRQVGPNDRLQIALIGAGGMGLGNLANCAAHQDVTVTAICDVWQARRDAACATYPTAKPYADYREVFQQSDVDAVIIATPPHWHCRMAVDACAAGKDIFLQKPMSLHVSETLAIKEAVKRHQRISQIGTQIHATDNYRRVVERVRSGQLGPIGVVRTFNVMNQGPEGIGNPPSSEPPAGLDWNVWVGPAPMCSYNPLITQDAYTNCSFMKFSGGWTPGMAPHIVDLPFWALELGAPLRTSCTGGRHIIQDAGDAPDVQEAVWQFPSVTMTWSMSVVNSFGFDFGRGSPARRLGIYFHGVNGTLYADYGMHEVVPEGERLTNVEPPPQTLAASPGHEREWLDCLRTRQQPSCCVDYHANIDLALNLANLSWRIGRDIRWDPETNKIVQDPEATRLARPEYREPWRFPAEYLVS